MKYLIAFNLILFFTCCLKSQEKIASNGLNRKTINITTEQADLIYEKTKSFPNGSEISIALINDEVVEFYGVHRSKDTIYFKDNSEKIFEIGSISKVFTSTLLATLEIENQLNSTDSIQQFFDFNLSDGGDITLLSLSNHTSGLSRLPSNMNIFTTDPNNPYKNYDEIKLIEFLSEDIIMKEKNVSQYEYSNLGAGILGYILARKAGTSYEELLQQKICLTYDMRNTTTNMGLVKEKLISGLKPNGEKASNWDFNALAGAGAILSSTLDLSKFAIAQFNPKHEALISTHIPTHRINNQMQIGMGWHIIQQKTGNDLLWHNGKTGGYTSSMALDLKTKNGIIILSNISAYHNDNSNIDDLCFELVESINNQ